MKKKHGAGVRLYILLAAAVILSGCASTQLSEEAISRIRDVKRIGVIQVLPAEARWDYYGTTIFHNSNIAANSSVIRDEFIFFFGACRTPSAPEPAKGLEFKCS